MQTIIAACPTWCSHDIVKNRDSIDEERTHNTAGAVVQLDPATRTALRVWLELPIFVTPLATEPAPTPVVMFELVLPARSSTERSVQVLPLGPAARWARTLRLAADELAAEARWSRDGDERPDWSFRVAGAGREVQGHALAVARHPGRSPLARLTFGFDDEVVTGVAGLRDAAAAVEAEVANFLDSAIL